MALDPTINFGKATVSTGYDAAATSIVLSSGHGAKLPSSFSYNLVWWNSTDYDDPADDPNVEIVRCTARSTDTLTVTRAQEGTAASTKNTGGKTYKMALCITKKMIDDIGFASAFSVHKNGTNQTGVATSTNTKVTWSTEDFDTNSDFASDKFTPTVAGKYLLMATVGMTTITDGTDLTLWIYKNGVAHKRMELRTGASGSSANIVTAIVEANGSTDYFEVFIFQNSGADKIISGDKINTFFQGFKMQG